MNQSELDRLMIVKRPASVSETLPKGLSRNTLRRIWDYIEETRGLEFTTEELVELVGISRISIRKYLSFLEKLGVITSYCSYGNIGRPLTMYQYKRENQNLIEPYLVD